MNTNGTKLHKRPRKTGRVNIRLWPSLERLLARDAAHDGVGQATIAHRILVAHYRARGLLPDPVGSAARDTAGATASGA